MDLYPKLAHRIARAVLLLANSNVAVVRASLNLVKTADSREQRAEPERDASVIKHATVSYH